MVECTVRTCSGTHKIYRGLVIPYILFGYITLVNDEVLDADPFDR
jgi:hypothetical protein